MARFGRRHPILPHLARFNLFSAVAAVVKKTWKALMRAR